MANAAPNQTRLKILASVLHLEQFTVADLCHHAGIERSQAYRILSDLQEEKVLKSSKALWEGEVAPRHRPSKRYVLTEDLGVRERIELELNSFLPASEDAHENRQLLRAQSTLRALSMELVSTTFVEMDLAALQSWEAKFEEQLQEVQRVLKRAFWESETDFSEGDHSNHPIIKTRHEFKTLESRFHELVRTENARISAQNARISWSNIFSTAVSALVPALNFASSPVSDELLKSAFKLSAMLIRELAKKPKSKEEWLAASHDALLRYLSSWELDLRDAQSSADAVAALAKNCIVYGQHADIAYQLCLRLVAQNKDYRSIFNVANLAHLAKKPEEAYESWSRYQELLNRLRNQCATPPLVARIPGDAWSAAAYEEAVQLITRDCQASVSAFSEMPFEKPEQAEIEPKLYNPLFEDGKDESPYISIGEVLGQQKRIYVVTSEVQRPVVVGLPRMVRANLFYCGIPERDAWDLSKESTEDERIIKVDWFRTATQRNRDVAQDILTSKLSAAIVTPIVAANQNAGTSVA
jgi:predicted ArsR family transcriptional regulator